jgi:hypothetical protein
MCLVLVGLRLVLPADHDRLRSILHDWGYHTRLECHRSILAEGRFFICITGGKTMTNEITITDDMKAVQRWENEGGQV